MDTLKAELHEGTQIAVVDKRKKIEDGIIADGIVESFSEQEGVKYAYLDTGYYIIIWPSVKVLKVNLSTGDPKGEHIENGKT